MKINEEEKTRRCCDCVWYFPPSPYDSANIDGICWEYSYDYVPIHNEDAEECENYKKRG